MNLLSIYLLRVIRKGYSIIFPSNFELRNWKRHSNKQYSNDLIYNKLMDNKPCMIARFGAFELNCIVNYLGIKYKDKFKNYSAYIKGESPQWWWNNTSLKYLHSNAGFFPLEKNKIEQFCKLMLNDSKEVDILGAWLNNEKYVQHKLENTKKVVLEDLEPFFSNNPWTRALEGKKVLVVHPFSVSIESQYKKRKLLFENNLLPEFELKTIKAVQSIAGVKTNYKDWFEALEYMKDEIDKTDYDICIIGAGAYGFPLAAHVKRKGKKAIHLAGVTQLLFGIKGSRWEQFLVWPYQNLFNEHWVRPLEIEKPKSASAIEDACYW